jgi:hypothetical protein
MLNTKFQRTLAGGTSLVKGFSAESVKELLEEKKAGATDPRIQGSSIRSMKSTLSKHPGRPAWSLGREFHQVKASSHYMEILADE